MSFKEKEFRKEVAKENQRIIRNLKRRYARIIKHDFGVDTRFGSSVDKKYLPFTVAFEKTKLSTRGLSIKDLMRQQKELQHLESMKTSYVKGAKSYAKDIETISKFYGSSKATSLYNRFVEEHALAEKFKYELMNEITNMMIVTGKEYEIFNRLEDWYQEKIYDKSIEDFEDVWTYEGISK